MAGVGEASAIVTLIGIAPQISKAVISAASNYKSARAQIESFGREVSVLGGILGELMDLLFVPDHERQLEPGVKTLLSQILGECNEMFSQLNTFSDKLHAKPNAIQSVNRRGKMKWVLGDKTELEYLRARVDSMKINILLMMTLQSLQNHKSSEAKAEENAKSIMKLSQENEPCIKRLQRLEHEGAHGEEHICGKISSSMSVVSAETVGTAGSVQSSSTWSSIFRAYGWTMEDGQLEKLDLVPSSLDGDTEVPAWLAQDPLPAIFTSRYRHDSDEKIEKAEALLAITEEEKEEDEMRSKYEMEFEIALQKYTQNTLFPMSFGKHTLSYSKSLQIGDASSPAAASTSSLSPFLASPPYDHGRLIADINAISSNIS